MSEIKIPYKTLTKFWCKYALSNYWVLGYIPLPKVSRLNDTALLYSESNNVDVKSVRWEYVQSSSRFKGYTVIFSDESNQTPDPESFQIDYVWDYLLR